MVSQRRLAGDRGRVVRGSTVMPHGPPAPDVREAAACSISPGRSSVSSRTSRCVGVVTGCTSAQPIARRIPARVSFDSSVLLRRTRVKKRFGERFLPE